MSKLNKDSSVTSTVLETPAASATKPTDKQLDSRPQTGSKWFKEAIEGATEMHRNEEARKEVARRLF